MHSCARRHWTRSHPPFPVMSDGSVPSPASHHPLHNQVIRAIRARALLHPGQSVLVAVSGGPDSAALLDSVTVWPRPETVSSSVATATMGFCGVESDEDASFVAALCRRASCTLLREIAPHWCARGWRVESHCRRAPVTCVVVRFAIWRQSDSLIGWRLGTRRTTRRKRSVTYVARGRFTWVWPMPPYS